MAVKQLATQESINPNIIPMIDIMFLILLFFMLSADMGHREFEEVRLPTADAVKEDKRNEDPKLWPLTVNCYHDAASCGTYECKSGDCPPEHTHICVEDAHWKIGIKGIDYAPDKLQDALQKEADVARDPNDIKLSTRRVQIRADRSALYGHVQKVMNACAFVGLYKIEIGAATKMEGH